MTRIGEVEVSRFLLGSNPFSGFSHQGVERDRAMVRHYTTARIKEALFDAERLGITGLVARTDFHVMRLLAEYRDEGGKLQWFAQTCPGVGPTEMCVRRAHSTGAVGCHIHGGVMDHLTARGNLDDAKRGVDLIHELGMAAGVAGHNVRVFEWAEENLQVDYYMCCHYNPVSRDEKPEHQHGAREKFRDGDRKAMTDLIQGLSKPAIHYKVLAAGRNEPETAFAFTCAVMRPEDMVCVGVFTGDDPKQLEENVTLFNRYLKRPSPAG